MKKERKFDSFIERRFLNQEGFHSTAAIVTKIDEECWGKFPNAEFHISNCDRTITLDIDSDSVKGIDNSIYKMQQIIEVAQNFQKELQKLKPYIKKVEEEEEKERKKERKSLQKRTKNSIFA